MTKQCPIATSYDEKDSYGFGHNTQEKVNEISGIGNHYTALFWEYDTRLGRRWNLDPKPAVGISHYAAFGNNPILYPDVLGDSIRITGTDGFKKKAFAKLQLLTNDELELKKDGLVVVKNPGTANEGKKLPYGTSLVGTLIGNKSPNVIVESKGDNKTQSIIIKNKDGKEIRRYGDVKYNPDGTTSGKDAEGNTERPAEIGLGHELIHVKHNNERTDFSDIEPGDDPENDGFYLDREETATRQEENQLRSEHDLPDRISEE